MKQVFIFSLPRSGSTLLQRNLMSHKEIFSTSEPWILLPQVYSLRSDGGLSEYGSLSASRAISDLIDNLPNKKQDYYDSLRIFINDIQEKLSINNETYFLDKTPRYYLIIDEIAKIFPEAKFIFLFRSPEQVYASMLQTWAKGNFRPFLRSYYDLVKGFEMISEGYLKHKNRSIFVKYEDFVVNPEKELKNILNYLQLDFDFEMTNKFSSQHATGRLGDPTGVKKYSTISTEGLVKWKKTFDTTLRQRIAYKMVNKISEEAYKVQGYDKQEVLNSIKSLPFKIKFSDFKDILDFNLDKIRRKTNLQLFLGKEFKWVKKRFIS